MNRPRHIPGSDARTYCGRPVASVAVIGPRDCVEDAECKTCQRSDDRRAVENHNRECKEAGIDPATGERIRG